ncbi:6-aminohexanoate-cyclic-dimer hydrolase [Candidatus Endolissoclinum faulkneri L5]|uniref:6-aminohexanoate-cyclic-dimer hydrolase n=1 Tax=Candidatus Endolissoclinum faulkneri L5 TaxID=1401328 RepID=V9TR00_9PROT|nr:amidase [Candidatus Endolissoclinum faulkneri]AHC73309.1 6-aminohexanoate-cyclic-dimer hydrolase [Candidatus Endolissoclinum faulkneri L5]
MYFDEYQDQDALGLARLIRKGEVSATEVVLAALTRADDINPKINAIVSRRDDIALAQSYAPLINEPFAGVPFVFKDLDCWQEGWLAEYGSKLWQGFIAPIDFTYTKRVKKAGMIPIARTTTSECGLSISTDTKVYGLTRNPWKLNHSAGGSSGGTAAAVAAGIVPVGHASDAGGSIRIPAATCGLFGLKPTRGRNPLGPLLSEDWAGLGTQHVISRSVRDSAAILDVTHGFELGDPYFCPSPIQPFLAEVTAKPDKLRIAYHTIGLGGQQIDSVNKSAIYDAVNLLEDLGHEIEEAYPMVNAEILSKAMLTIVSTNQKRMLNKRYFQLGRQQEYGDLEEVTIAFAEYAAKVSAIDYAEAIFAFHQLSRCFGEFFEGYDILLSTVLANPLIKINTAHTGYTSAKSFLEESWQSMPVTQFFNMTGCPAMSVPLFWSSQNLPIGIHMGAGFGREDMLFRLASQLEQARPWFFKRPKL